METVAEDHSSPDTGDGSPESTPRRVVVGMTTADQHEWTSSTHKQHSATCFFTRPKSPDIDEIHKDFTYQPAIKVTPEHYSRRPGPNGKQQPNPDSSLA